LVQWFGSMVWFNGLVQLYSKYTLRGCREC
jgi:hypothetical protein